jgi:hypothetical protein
MNRLLSELQRLYAPPSPEESADESPAEGRQRAMTLELARPADWAALGAVWRGVQADLGLPPPAIAVNGKDGYRLWFSLVEPVPPAQALAFLEGLRRRYLGGVAAERLRLRADTTCGALLPPLQLAAGQWSAFVAPDLAPVFADEPWLDTEPNPEGQADLLSRLIGIKSIDFLAALQALEPALRPAPLPPATPAETASEQQDARRFLLAVMNDASVALSLRIEAAKALLPDCGDRQRS